MSQQAISLASGVNQYIYALVVPSEVWPQYPTPQTLSSDYITNEKFDNFVNGRTETVSAGPMSLQVYYSGEGELAVIRYKAYKYGTDPEEVYADKSLAMQSENPLRIILAVSLDSDGEIVKSGFVYKRDDNVWRIIYPFPDNVNNQLEASRSGYAKPVQACTAQVLNAEGELEEQTFIFTDLYNNPTHPNSGRPLPPASSSDCYAKDEDENPLYNDSDYDNGKDHTLEVMTGMVINRVRTLGSNLMLNWNQIGVDWTTVLQFDNGTHIDLCNQGHTSGSVSTVSGIRSVASDGTVIASMGFNTYNFYMGTEFPNYVNLYIAKYPYDAPEDESNYYPVGLCTDAMHYLSPQQDTHRWGFMRAGGERPPIGGYVRDTSLPLIIGATDVDGEGNKIIDGANIDKKADPREEPIPDPEPDYPGEDDTSEGGGGEGNYNAADYIDSVDVPSVDESTQITGSSENNFARVYNPTDGEMRLLAQWMTDDNAIVAIKKYFVNDPMDFIVSYHSVPGEVTHAENKSSVGIGTYQSQQVTMYKVTNEMINIDCGSIVLEKVWGSANDYAPHCNLQLYLPFIGFQTLDVNMVLPKQAGTSVRLYLQYIVNALTGGITACLYKKIMDELTEKNIIIGEWSGNAMYKYPITSKNHDNAINAGISIATTAMSMAVGGIMAKAASAGEAGAVAGANIGRLAAQGAQSGIQLAQAIGTPVVLHGGGIQGSVGFNMGREPYLIVTRAHQALPKDYTGFYGFPAHKEVTVGEATNKGKYMQFSVVDIDGVPATSAEKSEIESLLLGGCYL